MEITAAESLKGLLLNDKWRVKNRFIPKSEEHSGGHFSKCYIVEDEDTSEQAFLKAIDYADVNRYDLASGNQTTAELFREMSDAFLFEKDLSDLCNDEKTPKVATAIDYGEIKVSGHTYPDVPFLIFELADGDARDHLEFGDGVDLAWKLRSLHNVTVGLNQLHSINVGHQDLKPSNLLVYDKQITKVGDLGRAASKEIISPHDDVEVPGTWYYAPFELLYHHKLEDWNDRVYSIDAFHLGSIITFYFSGLSINALVLRHLDDGFNPLQWTGIYADVLPYLINAFTKAMEEFRSHVPTSTVGNSLERIVFELCYPDVSMRGHPKDKKQKGNQYKLHRYISEFALLVRKVKLTH